MTRRSRIPTITPRIKTLNTDCAAPPPKVADPWYLTPEHRAWREAIIRRAGGQCEAVENGERCHKAEPRHRMFADHIIEIADGGDRLDVRNGRCLCGSHHKRKTDAERTRRTTEFS